MTRAVEPENACAVSSYHPLRSDANNRGDPVMFQFGSCGGVIELHIALLQPRESAQGSCHQLIAGNSKGVNMIVDQPLEGVHAASARGVQECQPCGCGQREPVLIRRDVGYVVGDEAIGASEDLLLIA